MVAHDPLHRSGRAGFPHPALALGDDAKPPQGIGVTHAGRRQPAGDEPPHPVPAHAAVLTPARQRAMPETAHLKPEDVERVAVRGHTVVADVSCDNRAQPRAHRRDGVVHASSEHGVHGAQLRLQSLANRLPPTVKRPLLRFFPQICVKPRKLNVSGFPRPRVFRCSAA